MIEFQIVGRKYEIDDELKDYIGRKLGRLDKYFPRAHQPIGMRVEVERHEAANPDKRFRVKVHVNAPKEELVAETATINPHSAVDVIEAKLKHQIGDYKSKFIPKRLTLKRNRSVLTEDTIDTA